MVNYRFSKKRFQGESWVKRILSSPWFFIFSFVFLVLSIFPLVRSVGSLRFVLSQEKRLNQESVELALQESQAEGEKAALQDPAFQELLARKNFGMKKPGEEVVVIVPPAVSDQESKEEISDQSESSWWANIFSGIRNIFTNP